MRCDDKDDVFHFCIKTTSGSEGFRGWCVIRKVGHINLSLFGQVLFPFFYPEVSSEPRSFVWRELSATLQAGHGAEEYFIPKPPQVAVTKCRFQYEVP